MVNRAPQRIGEIHPTYRLCLGGYDHDDNYLPIHKRHYTYTGQRRGAKVVNSIEQALHSL